MASRPRRPRASALRSKASHIKSRARKSAIKKAKGPLPSRDKVRAYRKRMRAKGLRLVQMWLPDTSTPEFKAQAHRDSVAIANSQDEQEMQAFLDSASWWNSEEARALENSEPPVPWWKEPEEGR